MSGAQVDKSQMVAHQRKCLCLRCLSFTKHRKNNAGQFKNLKLQINKQRTKRTFTGKVLTRKSLICDQKNILNKAIELILIKVRFQLNLPAKLKGKQQSRSNARRKMIRFGLKFEFKFKKTQKIKALTVK